MSDNTVNLIVNLAGNLSRTAQRYSRSLGRFASQGRRHMATLERGVNRVDKTMNRLGNRWVALGTGGALVVAAKGVIDFDARLQQLAVNADISSEELAKLKNQIFDVANSPNIRVDASELLTGVEEIIARTGQLKTAQDNLENTGLLMRATGTDARDSAALIANYYEKFDIKTAQKMLEMLGLSASLGKKGAFELRDLATEGNSVTAAYASTGRSGEKAIKEMNTMLQIIRRTTPSAAEAATSFERLISTITAEKVDLFQNSGIKIWDEEELKKGNKIARAVPDIILDILKVTGGDQERLVKAFDIRGLRAMNAFAAEYRRTRSLDSVKEFMAVTDDGSQILNDAGRNAKTAKAAINSLSNAATRFSDNNLSKPIQDLALWIDKLEPNKLQEMLETTKQWAIAIGGVALGFKAIALAFKAKNAIGSAKKGNGFAGQLLGASPATPMYVYVVSNGLGLGTDGNSKGGKKGGKGLGGKALSGLKTLATALPFLWAAKEGLGQIDFGIGPEATKRRLDNDLAKASRMTEFLGLAPSKKPIEKTEPARVEIELTGETKRATVRTRNRNRAPEVTVMGSL